MEKRSGKIMENTLKQELGQFTGTEHYYNFMNLKLTDGVKYLAEKGKCWWLLDVILSYQGKLKNVPFQLWEVVRKTPEIEGFDFKATVTCREDAGLKPLVTQLIPYTDFPLDEVKLYLIDGVILLPSEY